MYNNQAPYAFFYFVNDDQLIVKLVFAILFKDTGCDPNTAWEKFYHLFWGPFKSNL